MSHTSGPAGYLLNRLRERKDRREASELKRAQRIEAVQAVKNRCHKEDFKYQVQNNGIEHSFEIGGEDYSLENACFSKWTRRGGVMPTLGSFPVPS